MSKFLLDIFVLARVFSSCPTCSRWVSVRRLKLTKLPGTTGPTTRTSTRRPSSSPIQKVQNKDGTTTIIEYRFNEDRPEGQDDAEDPLHHAPRGRQPPRRRAQDVGEIRPERLRPRGTGDRHHVRRREHHLQAQHELAPGGQGREQGPERAEHEGQAQGQEGQVPYLQRRAFHRPLPVQGHHGPHRRGQRGRRRGRPGRRVRGGCRTQRGGRRRRGKKGSYVPPRFAAARPVPASAWAAAASTARGTTLPRSASPT